ncbi:thiamine-binding protein [Staphylospora marina]|uniref:thiamine-binding protein n=1 Tax=Staphylospora marina TaxID=2490858 RepID=UPI000F5BF72C|nr:MTH1187 family thiamine-binding protein [Staphylospora marina]
MARTLLSVQILPRTPDGGDVIPYVDRAIEVIQASGLPFRVGPLETTMEGELDELLAVVARMNEEMVRMGCPSVIHQIKIYHNTEGASMNELTRKYDPPAGGGESK